MTLLSHPQIADKLIEAGGAEDIIQNKIYISVWISYKVLVLSL